MVVSFVRTSNLSEKLFKQNHNVSCVDFILVNPLRPTSSLDAIGDVIGFFI